MATPSIATKDDIIRLVWAVYDPSIPNETRTNITNQLMHAVNGLNGAAILELGMTLMQLTNDAAVSSSSAGSIQSVRAYGAVILKQAVVVGTLHAQEVNPEALLSWISYDASISPVLRSAAGNLVLVCGVRLFPENWPTLLNTLVDDLQSKPFLLPLLKDFCDACVEAPAAAGSANAGYVPPNRIKFIRGGLKDAAPTSMRKVIQCMEQWYQQGQMQHVNLSLGALTSFAAVIGASGWWELGLHDVVRTLVKSGPCCKDAVSLAGSLIRTTNQMSPTDSIACALIQDLVQVIEPAIQSEDWELVQELLDMVADIPPAMAEQLQSTLVIFVQLVLNIPSVLFAIAAGDILKKLITNQTEVKPLNTSIAQPSSLLVSMSFFAQKHAVHPSFARSPCTKQATVVAARCQRAIAFSEEQFATLQSFDTAYADLRGTLANAMEFIALHFPQDSASYCAQLLSQLPTVKYPYDPSTRVGHYTQQFSQTFSEWSAAQFMLEHLAPNAFRGQHALSGLVAFRSLVAIAPQDAVLIPTWLNMQLAFWNSSKTWTDVSACNELWSASCDIVFRYMNYFPPEKDTAPSESKKNYNYGGNRIRMVDFDDVDLVSARKRACTAFVHAAVYHGGQLVAIPGLNLLDLCNQQLVQPSTLSSEKAFLYEAIASLSNFMGAEEQTVFLSSVISTMRDVVMNTNASNFLLTLCDQGPERTKLKDSVAVLASILRRCNPSPYMQSLAISIIPVMGNLLLTIHNAKPEQVPAAYRSLFEMSHVDRDQFLSGGGARKSSIASGLDSNAVGRARSALQQIRLYLYQALGSMGKFVALESFTPSLMQTVSNCERFELHTMRAFAENTLFRWLQSSSALGSFIFPALANYFTAQRVNDSNRSSQDEVVDHKQLFYFTKDTMTAVSAVVEVRNWFVQPGLREGVNSLLDALIQGAFDFRGTCGTVVRFIESNLLASPADAAQCFCCIASACTSRSPNIAPKDVDIVSGQLCFIYIAQMALIGGALRERGVPEELLVELNSHLALASRVDAKRRAFGDFLKKASQR
ncbi:Hypothetical protein, putative [Bodo saltans]|uniref:Exportin-T n=1 Tax=Bodo saltans TaxID=75058 RepID=A0A0S4JDK5_BODSA|nr:Hypothetical protein, putative [Bodo saltans]|eukprot:CUG87068.1 Hypothetical protein, putative [Bodo saltans]